MLTNRTPVLSLMRLPEIGCGKDQLDTPALCIDLDAMEDNVRTMVEVCREHRIAWRPHSKCHKSPAIARQLVAAGAIGVTCAKLGEAEVMAAGGVTDLLIANQIVGPLKVARLVELRRSADPIVCVDHLDQARPVADAMAGGGLSVRVLIEVDLGMGRAGVAPGEPAVRLARELARLPGITFAGIMGYEGHLLRIKDPLDKQELIAGCLAELVETRRQIEHAGIDCPIVSCGGTGSYQYSVQCPGITEIQAGGAIFMDDYYRELCHVPDLKFALTLVATVVSRPAPDRAIIDAGRKSMNPDIVMPRVISHSGLTVEALSAEHGRLLVEPEAGDLRIGDRLELIPGYSDFTCVLHDRFFGMRKGRLESMLLLEGRGRLQ